MSLINDALKKVSQAERGKPQTPPVDFESRAMQPAVYEKRSHNLAWISIALLAVAIVVAALIFAKHRQTPAVTSSSAVVPKIVAEVPKATVTEIKIAAAPAPAESPKTPVAEPSSAAVVSTNTISPATPAPAAQAALTPAQPAPAPAPASIAQAPVFRLKGILYTKNPTALINEASAHVGDEVDGATVKKIDATAVALEFEGKTITLKLAAR
jgi:cytoskeletal protein RodZ